MQFNYLIFFYISTINMLTLLFILLMYFIVIVNFNNLIVYLHVRYKQILNLPINMIHFLC